jgi:hypothetical protein
MKKYEIYVVWIRHLPAEIPVPRGRFLKQNSVPELSVWPKMGRLVTETIFYVLPKRASLGRALHAP